VRTAPAILDDPAAIGALDPGGMIEAIRRLGPDLVEGFEAGSNVSNLPRADDVSSVVVCGMGGSGLPGDVVRSVRSGELSVPLEVRKGYRLSRAVGPGTLVLAVSVSGRTEETLACYDQASAAGAHIAAVGVGGELGERARADGVPFVAVPQRIPVPRAAVGFLSGALLGVLQAVGLLDDLREDVRSTRSLLDDRFARLGPEVPLPRNEAKSVAAWIEDRAPVVWGTEGVAEAAALRWKNQFNENAKVPAFHSAMPELAHNEVEGWSAGTGAGFALVTLRHADEPPRVAARMAPTLRAVEASGLDWREVRAEGATALQSLFWLVQVGDLASFYLAVARGVDPMPTPVLSSLKDLPAR
jgi:glucose/mannose-6-phosphate isomerase